MILVTDIVAGNITLLSYLLQHDVTTHLVDGLLGRHAGNVCDEAIACVLGFDIVQYRSQIAAVTDSEPLVMPDHGTNLMIDIKLGLHIIAGLRP